MDSSYTAMPKIRSKIWFIEREIPTHFHIVFWTMGTRNFLFQVKSSSIDYSEVFIDYFTPCRMCIDWKCFFFKKKTRKKWKIIENVNITTQENTPKGKDKTDNMNNLNYINLTLCIKTKGIASVSRALWDERDLALLPEGVSDRLLCPPGSRN